MGKKIKEYFEKDSLGEHKVVEYSNGIKSRILVKPSSEYKKKIEKAEKEREKANSIKKKEKERESLIKNKMRELAIKELEKEGKL